ncbi:MAG TPA: hypothetical protein VJY35_06415 [Candidatus Eisenbacteria bacterium]|nr:hypothetical protein [Candidatus Eisenbacteria bacterium]
MHLRYRLVLPLVAICCLAFAVAPALAAKTAPTVVQQNPTLHPANATNAACSMGVLPPPGTAFGYILPPDDIYYTLLDPANCGACHENGRLLTTAHVLLYFTEPCQIPVSVSITPAFDNEPDGCFTPNPFAPPLCAPVQYVVNDGGVLNQCVQYDLPITSACCVNGKAFLTLEFDQGTCGSGRPAFCATGAGACVNCVQYNFYPGATFPGDDICAVIGSQVGVINMWADSDCCDPTPTLPGSWGLLKTLYR